MSVTLDANGLKKYLKTILDLEKSLCKQNILLNNLYEKLNSMGIQYTFQMPEKPFGYFPKHRTVVAMSMLYEYLASGRATQLEGHEGALNIYESELRLNNIIGKLDDVIYHLEDIKNNQSVLYDLISDANEKTDKILSITASRLERIDKQLGSTNHLLELNQYNSATAARNLSVLAYYQQLEHGHR